MRMVRTTIIFSDGYDDDAVDALVEQKFPEATLWYDDRRLVFNGSAERSNELIRAIETVASHDEISVRTVKYT